MKSSHLMPQCKDSLCVKEVSYVLPISISMKWISIFDTDVSYSIHLLSISVFDLLSNAGVRIDEANIAH